MFTGNDNGVLCSDGELLLNNDRSGIEVTEDDVLAWADLFPFLLTTNEVCSHFFLSKLGPIFALPTVLIYLFCVNL